MMKGKFFEKKWEKFKLPVLRRLVQSNRYSRYIDCVNFTGEEALVLESVIVAGVGKAIEELTGASKKDIVDLLSKFFECKFKKFRRIGTTKPRIKWIPKGVEISKLQGELSDIRSVPSSHQLGYALSDYCDKTHLVDKRLSANKYFYIANGYKKLIMQDGIKII